jgi:elongation factor P
MTSQKQLAPGLIISLNHKLFRVESCVKVTVPKGAPFIKAKLRDMVSQELMEKHFKPDYQVKDVPIVERKLEFLYPENQHYLFLDIQNLEQILIPSSVIGSKINYLKEGIEVKASMHGDEVFAIELPQFLEIMVGKLETPKSSKDREGVKMAWLETGAKVEVPPFIEVGDVIKIDTNTDEFIQRV